MTNDKTTTGLGHMDRDLVITDGGMETTLIFREGIDLPQFAAFVLLDDETGKAKLLEYFRSYAEIAREVEKDLLLESATWRANPDWAELLGYSPEKLDELNRASIEMLVGLRPEFETDDRKLIASGCIGPRGDGYVAGEQMSPEEAEKYHSRQVKVFKDAGADLVTAITMTYEDEAIGIANAAGASAIPCVISFTVETDGRLPNGSSLGEAITKVDRESKVPPAYYMLNCAHPSHFASVLRDGGDWIERIRGTRVNASKMSHEELDAAEELDDGNPWELAEDHLEMRALLPCMNVVGGCCGTDERHVGAIARKLTETSGESGA